MDDILILFLFCVLFCAHVNTQTTGTGSTSNITALVTSADIENFVSSSEAVRPLNNAVNYTVTTTTNVTTTVTNVTTSSGGTTIQNTTVTSTNVTSGDNNQTNTTTDGSTNITDTTNTTTVVTCPLLSYQPAGSQLIIFLNENRTCNLVVATRRVLLPFVPFEPVRSTYRLVAVLQNTDLQSNATCPPYPATLRGNNLIIITQTGEENCYMVITPEIRPVLVFNGLQQQFVDTVIYRISTPRDISFLG